VGMWEPRAAAGMLVSSRAADGGAAAAGRSLVEAVGGETRACSTPVQTRAGERFCKKTCLSERACTLMEICVNKDRACTLIEIRVNKDEACTLMEICVNKDGACTPMETVDEDGDCTPGEAVDEDGDCTPGEAVDEDGVCTPVETRVDETGIGRGHQAAVGAQERGQVLMKTWDAYPSPCLPAILRQVA